VPSEQLSDAGGVSEHEEVKVGVGSVVGVERGRHVLELLENEDPAGGETSGDVGEERVREEGRGGEAAVDTAKTRRGG
jgi:hypothetical protein